MVWATTSDVNTLTGQSVDDATRNLAASAIEIHTGSIEAVERTGISDRDLYWLKCAVCYQAAWIAAQPDYLERNALASASQDGQSVAMGNPDWLTLGPLARKAIKRLSWRGVRGLVIAARPGEGTRRSIDINSEVYDDSLPWRAM